ncbi:MAG: hypothetical protein JWN86_716 [Planctomycetota bacterium]|nr:hypothetical protein [Planctomycetota bacterium]
MPEDDFASPAERADSARRSAIARRASAARAGKPRGLDPAVNDRIYEADELEFLRAVDAYRRATGRKFPTGSELLGVLKSLGYAKPG